ncbi:glycosyltransferase [Rhodobacteraceae bacterium 63075]|nr:glycosyltransferase [Rhodobacteraceae bacterium 63075]
MDLKQGAVASRLRLSEQTNMTDIQILMGVCDGADYLPDQLRSLSDQGHEAWRLLVSDDSRDDRSREVIDGFKEHAAQEVRLAEGPGRGFAANYMALIAQSEPGMLAFADQDDVWMPDKLARAASALSGVRGDIPALYCARVRPWDGTRRWRPTPPLARAPGFANALVENIAMGNTIVLNARAAALARALAPRVGPVFAHDWWLYQLVSGVGGTVIHDDGAPVVLYRQHGGNAIGVGRGLAAQLRRKRAVLKGALAERLDLNTAALRAARAQLTPQNAALLDAFEAARLRRGLSGLREMSGLGLYRQRRLGTAGFFGAVTLGLV